jgi:hypothetical protein
MNRLLPRSTKVLGGFFAAALCAFPQAYTISAKPGAVNYLEGNAQLDGQPLTVSSLKAVFMNAGSVLETRDGKVEVLLTPGLFLRVGENSRVRMLKPSLVDTQIAIEAGESMLEVDEYVKDSHITVSVHGGLASIEKNGLYRFRADGEASVAVIDGKLDVSFGEKHTSVGKGHEALLTDALKTQEFDKNQADELFAWSNIRAQYNAALTYQAARSANSNSYSGGGYGGGNYGGGYGGLYNGGLYNGGFGGFSGNGWYWSNGFNSWLWMPGGQFFSPFGWGFYGPGFVSYAPVVVVPVMAGGGGLIPVLHPHPGAGNGLAGVTVPVNMKAPPAIGNYSASPAQYASARVQMAHSIASAGGFRTASGASVSAGGAVRASGGGSSSGSAHSSGGFASSAGTASGGTSGGGGHSGGSSGGHSK